MTEPLSAANAISVAGMRAADLQTPCLIVDANAFRHNVETMATALPGVRLRPHVKAFKSTALARELLIAGHTGFCAATAREIVGMAEAGLGEDLLLANELLDPERLKRLGGLVQADVARVTVAVDSPETVAEAAKAGIREVLIDVDIGMPRCGCQPRGAGAIADAARAAGMVVRGVMGYEGHIVGNPDRKWRTEQLEESSSRLALAHDLVGGDVISSGGTGTYDLNTLATEIQAGSYVLMDTHYDKLGLPFRQGLALMVTVISVTRDDAGSEQAGTVRWAVGDGGLKALGMDHGEPAMIHGDTFFCSDEHITFVPDQQPPRVTPVVGDRVLVRPAHIDPTIAMHEVLHVVEPIDDPDPERRLLEGDLVETWPIDLRGW